MTKPLCLLLFILSGLSHSFAQNIDSLLQIQRIHDPQEKTYVHFDKNYYNPGETIWFKAYLFAGIEPAEGSTNFYAELVDEQGNVLSQKTAPIFFASSYGSFDLDSTLQERFLYFRGYTVSQLNSDTSFIYTRAIQIIPPRTSSTKQTTTTKAPVIRFLPEGGDWVAGLPSVIAFIARDQNEAPVAITGQVRDEQGIKVADLNTIHNGMGLLRMTPVAGKTYTANWKDASGIAYTTPLPPFREQGIVLRVTNEKGRTRYAVFRSKEVSNEMRQLHVIGTLNQQVAFKSVVDLSQQQMSGGLFPTADLPSGLLQITVFDRNYLPVAERITFINNRNHEFEGDILFTQKDLSKRGFNEIEIVMSDTLPANLSLSVTDAMLNQGSGMDDNIISRLLLTGDLRGRIIDPYYYFLSNSDSASMHLDLVMLTHGWRRYNWENVVAGKIRAPKWEESNYLSLNGRFEAIKLKKITPTLQINGILQTADSAKNYVTLAVDKEGKVFMDGLVFYDTARLNYNFNEKSWGYAENRLFLDNGLRKPFQKLQRTSLPRPPLSQLDSFSIAHNRSNNQQAIAINRRMARSGMLQNIIIRRRTKTTEEKMEETYVSSLFSGGYRQFDLVHDSDAVYYFNVLQYLQRKAPNLYDWGYMGGASREITYYLNEMRTDKELLETIPVSEIAYVKVFRPGELILAGSRGAGIAVYTRKGEDYKPRRNLRGLGDAIYVGYSPRKEFYSPDYASFEERHSYDDVRSTLYWNPMIFLDKSRQRITIRFYNNDITNRFRLVLEGINAAGKLIHIEKEMGE